MKRRVTMNELYEEHTIAMCKEDMDKSVQLENYTNRVITINKDITEDILETVTEHIIKWNKEDAEVFEAMAKEIMKYCDEDKIDYSAIAQEAYKPIVLKISTDGGLLIDGLGLVDVILASTTPIIGVNMAKCFSMGSLILTACHYRYSLPNSSILYHDGSFGMVDSTKKMIDYARYIERLDNRVKQIILENTDIDEETYDKNAREEWYIFPEEAVELGIIDGIIGKDVDFCDIL